MPKLAPSTPRCVDQLQLIRRTPKVTLLNIPNDASSIMFYEGEPIAAILFGSSITVREGVTRARQAAVNSWHEHLPQYRSSAAEFDFIVGQILIRAGNPLIHIPESHNARPE